MAVTGSDDPARPEFLANLSLCLRLRYARTGAVDALSEAITVGYEAAAAVGEADSSDRGTCLMSLGLALLARFERFGEIADLTEAVRLSRAATEISDGIGTAAIRLANLSVALQVLDEYTNAAGALIEAVSAARRAPAGYPARSSVAVLLPVQRSERALAEIAARWRDRRFRRSAPARTEAVRRTAPDNPDWSVYLSNLGGALQTRAERTGSSGDLEAALRVQIEAMDLTPTDHADRGRRLVNLAVALKVRAIRGGSEGDLDAAVRTAREAAGAMRREHADRIMALTNLGSALRDRFERYGSLDDITEAIRIHRDAVASTGVGKPDRGGCLSNYGTALIARAQRTRSVTDLGEAISSFESALDTSPPDAPDRAFYLRNLGNASRGLAELTDSDYDRRAAIALYAAAVESGTAIPSVRVAAAAAMAEILTDPDPARHADVLAVAVQLMPRLAGRSLTRGDQQEALRGLSLLVADAAGITLLNEELSPADRAERALRLIEVGRTVIRSQALRCC